MVGEVDVRKLESQLFSFCSNISNHININNPFLYNSKKQTNKYLTRQIKLL